MRASEGNQRGRVLTRPPAAEGGQGLVEMALLLPLFISILLMIIEGGLLLRNHSALVTATWVGARFVLDGGTDADMVTVMQQNSSNLSIVSGKADIYVVRGTTTGTGTIATWTASPHKFGTGPAQPQVTSAAVLAALNSPSTAANVNFVVVEVGYSHSSLTGSWVLPLTVPLRSYAVVQRQ